MTDAWQGYNNIGQIDDGICNHAAIVNHNVKYFVGAVHGEIHTETIEGLWM